MSNNFGIEEERQLTRSVLSVSQHPITGNQQNNDAFWQHILAHFNANKPCDERLVRSLKSKWGQIKHDIAKFISVHLAIKRLKPTCTSLGEIILLAKELYSSKHLKNLDFTFEHCWVLVRDFPHWVDGWVTNQTGSLKRKVVPPNQGLE